MGLSGRPDSPVSIELTLWIYLGLSVITSITGFCIKAGVTHGSLKFRSPRRNFAATWRHPIVRLSILGLSAFWGITQIFLILIQKGNGPRFLHWKYAGTGKLFIERRLSVDDPENDSYSH
jgi:hypothetical protein